MSNAPPIIIPAPNPDATQPATIIFLHGFGDDAHGWTDLVSQIHSANKLSHVKWILPNAPENRDAMAQAWYLPKPFSPIPMSRRSGESETDDDEDDEEGLMESVDYICGLIANELEDGKVPLDRIVVGGFSQGCAISLLVGLLSRCSGELGGVVGLSGYLPLEGKIGKVVAERKEGARSATKWFLAHGSRDQLVPRRMFTSYKESLEKWEGDNVEARVYEGMPHSTTGQEIRDLCTWLEGTHYWETYDNPAKWAAAFPKIVEDTHLIVANAKYPTTGPESEEDDPRIISPTDGIRLNGVDEDHEPFELTPGGNSQHCKTARKPYDETVTAILIRAKVRAGSAIRISSDGNWREWQDGRDLVERIWPMEKAACPFDRTSCDDYDRKDDGGYRQGGKLTDWACPVPACYKTFWEREDNLMAHIASVHLTADEERPGWISTEEARACGLGRIDGRF